ncbi:hypothetical protein L1049_010428 [Liquidambar formosana]|uniref:F-box domain-containing protein n=1 Tax=Liquidambar formosana TaxID=63359 RepID=A0AAP0R4B3_LIQFO
MSTLPSDVIMDILSRLPVKTLLRFKSASKPWRDLIDCPYFIKAHLKRSMDRGDYNLSLSPKYFETVPDNAVPIKAQQHSRTGALGSCNGLLCLLDGGEEDNIALWNPSTRKLQTLPFTPIQPPRGLTVATLVSYGFGYDSVNDDYKLVRMAQFTYSSGLYGSFESQVDVYSLKMNSWRRIQDFPYYLPVEQVHGELACGALHWIVLQRPRWNINIIVSLVAAFDLGLEEYREVPLPQFLGEGCFVMSLGVLGGCLCLLCHYGDHVDMWVMKEYGLKESWTILSIVLDPQVICPIRYLQPLTYSKNGDQILFVGNNSKIIWYDFEKKKFTDFQICGNIPKYFEVDICLESLVPINGDVTSDGKKQQSSEKKMRKKRSIVMLEFMGRSSKLGRKRSERIKRRRGEIHNVLSYFY